MIKIIIFCAILVFVKGHEKIEFSSSEVKKCCSRGNKLLQRGDGTSYYCASDSDSSYNKISWVNCDDSNGMADSDNTNIFSKKPFLDVS